MTLEEAQKRVMNQIFSLEAQGALPYDGGTIVGYTALFQGVDPDLASKAIWSLIDDGTLTIDKHTDLVDIA